LKDGARIAAGGKRFGDEGFFVQPTLFTQANNKMRISQEEIFGPVRKKYSARYSHQYHFPLKKKRWRLPTIRPMALPDMSGPMT